MYCISYLTIRNIYQIFFIFIDKNMYCILICDDKFIAGLIQLYQFSNKNHTNIYFKHI